MSLTESRRYPRVSADNIVRVWSPVMADGQVLGTLEQLSLGGCLFNTAIAFEPGRVLTFKIEVKNQEISAVGEVIYRRMKDETSFMCGVRFEKLSLRDEAQLKSVIASKMENAA